MPKIVSAALKAEAEAKEIKFGLEANACYLSVRLSVSHTRVLRMAKRVVKLFQLNSNLLKNGS